MVKKLYGPQVIRASRLSVRRGHLRCAQHHLRTRGGTRDILRLCPPRTATGEPAAFDEIETYASRLAIPEVPVLFKGCFGSVAEIRAFLKLAHGEPSVIDGQREGVILRVARSVLRP